MESTRNAAIIQTDLDPNLMLQIVEAFWMREGGYKAAVTTAGDLDRLVEAFQGNQLAVLDEWFKQYQLIILDEQVGDRSAFEFLANIKAYTETRQPEIRNIVICLLCSSPSDFTVMAAWNAGVDRILNKDNPEDITGLENPSKKTRKGGWQRFTERARRIVFFAQEEAARMKERYVSPEHLLLGLVRESDNIAARILDRLEIPLESIQSEIRKKIREGSGIEGDMQLTSDSKQVIDLAYDEMRLLSNDYIGTEHLLLALIREDKSPAAQVLIKLGASLDRVRKEVREMQA